MFARTGVANQDAVITVQAKVGGFNILSGVRWSYDGTPGTAIAGKLTINFGSVTETYDIVSSGPGFIPFYALYGDVETAMVITLHAVAGQIGSVGATLEKSSH